MDINYDLQLNIANTVDVTESEGIGDRFAIWTQGCKFKCPGCCNPHLWTNKGGKLLTVLELWSKIQAAKVKYPKIEGVTFIGGEPLEQAGAVAEICKLVQKNALSVMIFTGFLLEDLQKLNSPVLPHTDILVDGLYVESLRTTTRRFIGSTNQKMHFLSNFYSPDDPRWLEANSAEIMYTSNKQIQFIGFPFGSL
jgi:anaerobic ribonucleoside-triphosphate reductase activating protein